MIPRIGAFEVSFKGIILFSKMMSSVWPHFVNVSKHVDGMFNDIQVISHAELARKYTFNGKVLVQPRAGKAGGPTSPEPLGSPRKAPGAEETKAQPVAEAQAAQEESKGEAAGDIAIKCGSHL